jgi:3-methyl-2-oxobutanoate hydroxymethyltransferase
MNPDFAPKFVKRYADLAGIIGEAVGQYRDEVRSGAFPGPEHSFGSEKPAADKDKPEKKAQVVALPLPGACAGMPVSLQPDDRGPEGERPLKLYSTARDA